MASQGGSLPLATLAAITCLCAFQWSAAMDIPLEVEQLPTITAQSPSSYIAFPYDENFPMTCEAKGNPEPEFRWTKNGMEFEPSLDPRLVKEENSGTFVIPNNGNRTEYQGTYRCYASNRLGTAISQEIDFIVPNYPMFPKETIDPVVVEEGQPFVLKCNPPAGIPPLHIHWMTINLFYIEQDERVSMSLDGDLYFSHAEEKDSRRDYCCIVSFPTIRAIIQKTAMSVVVTTNKSVSPDAANAILQRRPTILMPSGVRSEVLRVKGDSLKLECIAEGYPTPKVEFVKMGHRLPAKAKLENHGKLLIVPDVEQEDAGHYMCRVKNVLGEAVHYFTVTVEEPPEWESEPESQLSMIGSKVVVKCSAYGTPEPSITWRVNGVPLHASPAANRKVLGDTIVIHDAQASDSAVYQCEAANVHGKLLSNANILIMNLAPVVLTPDEEEYSAVEGMSLTMHCEVFSSPPPDIYWSRGDSSAEPVQDPRFSVRADGSLEISGVRAEDAGRYTCLGKNTEGTSDIHASLHVKEPTRIVVPPEDLHILIGTTAQLSCTADYDASFSDDFELLWEKDGVEISLNDTEASRYFVENGVLQIVNVSHSDRGVYTCAARTPVDGDEASATLLVLDVPDAPEHLVLSEHKGKSVKLKWIPGDDHNSSTTEFVVEFEESQWEPGNWKELLRVPGNHLSAVLRLHGHVDYRFRVAAINGVGRGQPSEPSERYKTPPSAPDRNPENIRIEGQVPHEMDINWEPLLPMEHNGPGLEYKVSYRRQDVEDEWREHMVKRHSFVVKNTPTFVPYEIKIQARNHQGWGPEPRVVSGYSGEDFPSAAPEDVAVEVINSSVVKVSWTRVHKDNLHGHLGGYRLSWWRLRSLADSKRSHESKETVTFPGDRNHGVVAGLTPYSEYSLIVMTFNGRGNGPGSHAVNFRTPEGVPEKNPLFSVKDVHKHSISLVWSPPPEPNGILTGYLLEYQLVNDTEAGPLQTVDISDPDVTKWTLRDLEPLTKYKFYLRSCTTVGCGPVASEESTTTLKSSHSAPHSPPSTSKPPMTKSTRSNIGQTRVDGGISTQGWFIGLMCAIALLTLIVLIACFVNRNKGGKYSVKEKEDLHPDVESQGMNDDTFCEYSDNDEKPLKGSRRSLSGEEIKAADSGDSLVDYGDEDAQFNEDGSFIGEYAGRKEKRASVEVKAVTATQTPA